MKHLNIFIKGRVYKVGFRFSAMEIAYRYGIYGIVKYDADGSIYIEAEAEEEKLNKFLMWCKRGPIGARVQEMSIEGGEPKNYTAFDIN